MWAIGGLSMLRGIKLIDSTLVIVLNNGEQEIERDRPPMPCVLR
jgi:hypothetical protein